MNEVITPKMAPTMSSVRTLSPSLDPSSVIPSKSHVAAPRARAFTTSQVRNFMRSA